MFRFLFGIKIKAIECLLCYTSKNCIENTKIVLGLKKSMLLFLVFQKLDALVLIAEHPASMWSETWGNLVLRHLKNPIFLIFKFIIVYTVTIHYNLELHI